VSLGGEKQEAMMRMFASVALIVACVLMAGCMRKTGQVAAGKPAEPEMAKQDVKSDVQVSDDRLTIQTKDGSSSFSSGKAARIPDNFPKDVHIYDGATPLAVITMPIGFSLQLETKDDADKVMETYRRTMAADGWSTETANASSQQTTLSYRKDKSSVNIMVMKVDQKTRIAMIVLEQK
jgi:hypothetical protein